MEMAQLVASWSKDPSTKCGAVVVRPDKTVASLGFNGFPRGMSDDPLYYLERDIKYSRVIHAEMNALLTAKEELKGYTLYVFPFCPCDRCCVHVIQAGIARVVFPAASEEILERWGEQVERSMVFFKEAGVEVEVLDE